MKVGFVGLGAMGAPMARNLKEAGFQLAVHNRTRDREIPLARIGCRRAATPSGTATKADVVCVCVSDTPDVEEVLFGPQGVAAGAPKGCVVVDHSTISPEATKRFGERLHEKGLGLVDAPVSGGPEGAEAGTLSVMVGGDPQHVDRVRPVLDVVGGTVTHVGAPGAGQSTKAVNQVIVGGMYQAVAEGIALARASGLDVGAALEAIGGGACRSWVLENRAPNMAEGRYPPGFRLSLHLKDLRIALAEAEAAGVRLPLAEMLRDLEERLVADGHGDEDVSAIARAIVDP